MYFYITSVRVVCNGLACSTIAKVGYTSTCDAITAIWDSDENMTKIKKSIQKALREQLNWIITRDQKAYCPECTKKLNLKNAKKRN